MLRMRRCRNIRIVLYILLLGSLLYLFLHDDILPFLPRGELQSAAKYAPRATYEYSSIYRCHANRTLEASLDAQLLSLEQSIRSSLPPTQSLQANLTIHQTTTMQSATHFSVWVDQWRTNNPGWTYNLLTTYPTSLLSSYSSIPAIVSAFETYPSLRPDLARYLLLWFFGGFYADINTWERVSLKDCGPIVEVTQGKKEVSLMIGVERDEPFYSPWMIEENGWSRGFGFGTSVMWAPRRFDPVLRKAIVRSISHSQVQERLMGGSSWMQMIQGSRELEEDEREEISGAGMLTDAVLELLSDALKEGHELRDRDAGLERRVSWKKFKGLKNVLWLGSNQAKQGEDMRGLAILPINVWSNGQNSSGSGTFEADDACVNQIYGTRSKKEWHEKFLW